jgi:quercetin dioxygenase-like cupin family protein
MLKAARRKSDMIFKHENAQVVYGTQRALGLQLAALEGAEFVELTLLKEGNIPPHSLEVPATFYVVTGEGTVSIDGKAFAVKAGDVAASPAGSTREVTNTGDGDFKLLVVKGR